MSSKPEFKIVTEESRFVFPNLFEAKRFKQNGKEQGDPKFWLTQLFEPTDVKPLKAMAANAAKAKWPGRDLSELKFPFADGNKEADKAASRSKDGEFFRGKVVVRSSSKYQPNVCDKRGVDIIDKAAVYSGCYGRAELNFVAYNGVGANPDGVTAYVNFVMKTKDGERLAGKTAADVFGNLIDEDDPGVDVGVNDPSSDLDDEIPF